MAIEEMPANFAKRVGERLRAIRLQKGFSLHDVEARSGKEFKASVLGAYERGERSLSVPRLQRLAMFYGVPLDRLLPKIEGATISLDAPSPIEKSGGVRLDLSGLRETDDPIFAIVARYAAAIQVARGDFNGRVLTIRESDIAVLCAAIDLEPEILVEELSKLGPGIGTLV